MARVFRMHGDLSVHCLRRVNVGFWWVALTSVALCGLYELLWAVLNRSNSRRR